MSSKVCHSCLEAHTKRKGDKLDIYVIKSKSIVIQCMLRRERDGEKESEVEWRVVCERSVRCGYWGGGDRGDMD